MARTQSENYADIRREILRRSAALFARVGYPNASIADLAKANRISRGLLYHYFDSKEKILAEMLSEHLDFLLLLLGQLRQPCVVNIDVAGRAGARATALRGQGKIGVANDLHRGPIGTALDRVFFAFAVGDDQLHQATPNFFCRLVDDVVYWKRSFSSGRQ